MYFALYVIFRILIRPAGGAHLNVHGYKSMKSHTCRPGYPNGLYQIYLNLKLTHPQL